VPPRRRLPPGRRGQDRARPAAGAFAVDVVAAGDVVDAVHVDGALPSVPAFSLPAADGVGVGYDARVPMRRRPIGAPIAAPSSTTPAQ